MNVRRIAIIGGGTAGWLAANHLAIELKAEPDIEITVIESPDIGIIGVGEGTVPHIRKTLRKFGISEAELLASCDCTFKNGIKFVDWLSASTYGAGNYYYHPFSSPYPSGYDVTPLYLKNMESMDFSDVTEVVLPTEAMKCPKKISSTQYEGAINYAYHFNAVKFGALLAKNAKDRLGVKHLIDTIISAKLNAEGDVGSIIMKNEVEMEFDFYVDCSGFSGLLIDKLFGVSFIDKSEQILTDTAMAVQIKTHDSSEIPPYTLATAHAAGWIWDIPLTNRRGVGFIYASEYMDESEAIKKLSHYLNIAPDDLSPRKIPMRIGYREKFWVKNCVALGLAQGFVEPLEATSILVTDFAAELFARNFSINKSAMSAAANYCNRVVAYTWERVIDFVQMHYCISDRKDSLFWSINVNEAKKSDVLMERLEMWNFNYPKKSDFFSRFDLFDVDNYLYVLYGMKYPTQMKNITPYEEGYFKSEILKIKSLSDQLNKELLGHREWITKFNSAYAKTKMNG